MADKDFKTIDEQIEILRSRGLTIEDEAEAKDFLLRNNYYRVSGYSLTLRKNDVFAKSATFQNIEDIYNFDHEFRHIILHHIETIEVQIKSIYAYEFTKVYGPLGYLDAANFSNQAKHKEIVDKANQQKRQRLAHEAYLKHFINDLHQEIPLWAYVDLLTISDISFLYSISECPLKETIAHRFGLTMNRGPEILGQYMHSMTIIRNFCAVLCCFLPAAGERCPRLRNRPLPVRYRLPLSRRKCPPPRNRLLPVNRSHFRNRNCPNRGMAW